MRYLLTCYFNPAFHAAVLRLLHCYAYRIGRTVPDFIIISVQHGKKTPFTSLKACLCAKNTMKREKKRERNSVIQNKIILLTKRLTI